MGFLLISWFCDSPLSMLYGYCHHPFVGQGRIGKAVSSKGKMLVSLKRQPAQLRAVKGRWVVNVRIGGGEGILYLRGRVVIRGWVVQPV